MKVTEFTGEVKALTSLCCTITVTYWFNINHQSIFYPNRGDFNYIRLIEVSVWMRIKIYQFVFHIFSKLCWLWTPLLYQEVYCCISFFAYYSSCYSLNCIWCWQHLWSYPPSQCGWLSSCIVPVSKKNCWLFLYVISVWLIVMMNASWWRIFKIQVQLQRTWTWSDSFLLCHQWSYQDIRLATQQVFQNWCLPCLWR